MPERGEVGEIFYIKKFFYQNFIKYFHKFYKVTKIFLLNSIYFFTYYPKIVLKLEKIFYIYF